MRKPVMNVTADLLEAIVQAETVPVFLMVF